MLFKIGFLSVVLLSILMYLIPRSGILFLFLKCPNCHQRGGLMKTWKFSGKAPKSKPPKNVLDDELVPKDGKVLQCKLCDHQIEVSKSKM